MTIQVGMHPNRLGCFYLGEEKSLYLLNDRTQDFSVSKKLNKRSDTTKYQKRDFGSVVTLFARANQKNQTQ